MNKNDCGMEETDKRKTKACEAIKQHISHIKIKAKEKRRERE